MNTLMDYIFCKNRKTVYIDADDLSIFFKPVENDFNGAAAAACIAIMPIVIAYICLQKYFIQGTIDSAVKG